MNIGQRKVRLLVVGFIFLIAGLFAWRIHYHWKWAALAYKQQLRAAGERLDIGELIPIHTAPEQNSAGTFLKAMPLLNSRTTFLATNVPSAMRFIAPGKAMIGWAQPDIRSEDGVNSWEEANAAVALDAEALELLQQIIERPQLDFMLDYRQGPNLLLPHLSPLKKAAQSLSAVTILELHRGDPDAAVKNVRAMLALTKGMEKEPLMISQLVRIAIARISLAANWEMLQCPAISEQQLNVLQHDWMGLEFIQAAENALLMERAFGETLFTRMRESSAEFERLTSGLAMGGTTGTGGGGGAVSPIAELSQTLWEGTRVKAKESMWRIAWAYPDELRALKGHQALLETIRLAGTNGFFMTAIHQADRKLEELGIKDLDVDHGMFISSDDLDLRVLFSQSVVWVNTLSRRVMMIESSRRILVTAIALHRYQLDHGCYPSELAALAPEFLPALPRDPVDGCATALQT